MWVRELIGVYEYFILEMGLWLECGEIMVIVVCSMVNFRFGVFVWYFLNLVVG